MPGVSLEYRLRIRNQADNANLIVLSSRAGDANCLLTEEPSGDGQRVDVFTGQTEVGTYTWRAIDRNDGGDTRTITALLSDADARNQMLSNKCVGEYSRNGGAWTAFHTGFLNAIKLPDALVYEFTVGDTDRREQDAELFRAVTDTFDKVCCIIGGPVVASPDPAPWGGPPVRAFGPVIDYGPARFQVRSNPSGLVNPTNRVTLELISGNFPPLYLGNTTNWTFKLPAGLKITIAAEEIDRLARPYFEWDGEGEYATGAGTGSQPFGSFPGLEVKLTKVVGGTVTRTFPIAQATKKATETLPVYGGPEYAIGDYSALVANSNTWLIVAWDTATMGSQPANGTQFDVLVYPRAISEQNPLHLRGHPIDLHTAANDQENIPYDAATADAVKTALGPLFYELRIKGPMPYTDFVALLKSSAGYATRYGADGEQEFFATRLTQPSAVATVTVDDIPTDEEAAA